jgi:UDP-N-acetylmuramoylalanine--D-glutamate ligase
MAMMNVFEKHAIVIGLGRSGVAAARLLRAQGARVTGMDAGSREQLSADALLLESLGIVLETGAHRANAFDGADLVVVSPGVPHFAELQRFEESGREVIGELELASRFVSAPIALIGGTNGKSTTTALVAEMCRADDRRTFLGGNFGTPLSEATAAEWDALVVEISSFQAERVPTLHARVHALLNVTDDHLDRYASFADYARAKGNPFERMTPSDTAVVPEGDALCAAQAARGSAQRVTFSASRPADVALVGDAIVDRRSGERYPTSLLRIAGTHNLENACAAIATATALDVAPDAIRSALASFSGLGHRCAFVAEIDGVRYYDDSKGTNVGASVAALRGLAEPKAVLIAGGRDKLGAYEPLVQALRDKGRALIVIGEAAERIAEAAAGALVVSQAATMADAVERAAHFAHDGDAVLLSPACSSFDMFRDYKHRGDAFVEAVHALLRKGEP